MRDPRQRRIRLTEDQFGSLAKLLRLRQCRSREAARLVLVEGVSITDAARATGLSRSAVSNVIFRCRRGLEMVFRVCKKT